MFRTIIAVLFAALIAEVTTIALGSTSAIEANTSQRSLKGDKLQTRPAAPACSQAAWPYYEANCVRGRTQPTTQPRETRVVAIDRLPAERPEAVN
jgi:hypothetical protein